MPQHWPAFDATRHQRQVAPAAAAAAAAVPAAAAPAALAAVIAAPLASPPSDPAHQCSCSPMCRRPHLGSQQQCGQVPLPLTQAALRPTRARVLALHNSCGLRCRAPAGPGCCSPRYNSGPGACRAQHCGAHRLRCEQQGHGTLRNLSQDPLLAAGWWQHHMMHVAVGMMMMMIQRPTGHDGCFPAPTHSLIRPTVGSALHLQQ